MAGQPSIRAEVVSAFHKAGAKRCCQMRLTMTRAVSGLSPGRGDPFGQDRSRAGRSALPAIQGVLLRQQQTTEDAGRLLFALPRLGIANVLYTAEMQAPVVKVSLPW